TVECARQCPLGEVFAIESDDDACLVLNENLERFRLQNVTVIKGTAPGALHGLQPPTHVFIGGTGGHAREIIDCLTAFSSPIRLCATAVTMESAETFFSLLSNRNDFSAVQIAVSRIEPVGSFHMFRVPDSYKPYAYTSNIQENALYRAMYTKLEAEAQTDPTKLFPLAYMSYYGAGLGKKADETDRLSKAIVQMQKLADAGCLRASAWLIPVYYNLSIDEKHYPMRMQRKKFRELSDAQMSTMLMAYNPYVYGLNGDILASGNSDPEEIAAEYEKGASQGDAYSLYRLGMAYKEGVIKSRDLDQSLDCFRKSADKGYADAYWQIALAYKSGLGVQADYNQYIHCLFQAIDAGSIEAVDELSVAFFWGIGVDRDIEMAQQVRRNYFYLKNNIWRDVLTMYGFPSI
ncbi:MAG: hypothetical protein IJG63_01950, partial [Oscillospiraceae bacterium]|nr:hypothetical protein [Oscillospiraceae bacterium]